MIKPLKSLIKYYIKGFFIATGLLLFMNIPEINPVNIFKHSLIFAIGIALLIKAIEDIK